MVMGMAMGMGSCAVLRCWMAASSSHLSKGGWDGMGMGASFYPPSPPAPPPPAIGWEEGGSD